jgi:hypothetical protein
MGDGNDSKLSATPRWSAGEKPWAWGVILSFFAAFGCAAAHWIWKLDSLLYVAAGLVVVHLVCRWRIEIFEEAAHPEKARRRSLVLELIILAFVVFPVLAALLMIANTIRALLRDEAILTALGRGALMAGVVVAALAVLAGIGRLARRFFFPS